MLKVILCGSIYKGSSTLVQSDACVGGGGVYEKNIEWAKAGAMNEWKPMVLIPPIIIIIIFDWI